jgi:hypothetical protein
MSELPWDSLGIPTSRASFTTKLVDNNNKWDEYWALDYSGNLCLMVACPNIDFLSIKLPRLQELDVKLFTQANGENFLLFQLQDEEYRGVFHEFCLRLIQTVEDSKTTTELVKQALLYTWRWYRFLRGKQSEILSPEEQRGLMGELCFLKSILTNEYTWSEALEFWIGPFENPKDFVWGGFAVEVKTHLNVARPFIKISSEYQLDRQEFEQLWLVTQGFQKVSVDNSSGQTLTDLIDEIMDWLTENEPSAVENFVIHLSAYGFSFSHDYSEYRWDYGDFKVYEVSELFPSIQSPSLIEGIRDVRYKIALAACEQFEVSVDVIKERLNES